MYHAPRATFRTNAVGAASNRTIAVVRRSPTQRKQAALTPVHCANAPDVRSNRYNYACNAYTEIRVRIARWSTACSPRVHKF